LVFVGSKIYYGVFLKDDICQVFPKWLIFNSRTVKIFFLFLKKVGLIISVVYKNHSTDRVFPAIFPGVNFDFSSEPKG
tara:strand:- start:400 stop:633 length:234 start_codon:yes stop_codon:yes gene_type:complete